MADHSKSVGDLIMVLILGVFAFVIGGAWNGLVNTALETYVPNIDKSLIYRFVYVSILTVIAIFAVVHLSKYIKY